MKSDNYYLISIVILLHLFDYKGLRVFYFQLRAKLVQEGQYDVSTAFRRKGQGLEGRKLVGSAFNLSSLVSYFPYPAMVKWIDIEDG